MSQPFEGSFRQLRGRIVEALRGGPMPVEALAAQLRQPPASFRSALEALAVDGVVSGEFAEVARLAEA